MPNLKKLAKGAVKVARKAAKEVGEEVGLAKKAKPKGAASKETFRKAYGIAGQALNSFDARLRKAGINPRDFSRDIEPHKSDWATTPKGISTALARRERLVNEAIAKKRAKQAAQATRQAKLANEERAMLRAEKAQAEQQKRLGGKAYRIRGGF